MERKVEIYVPGGHPKVSPSMTEQEYFLYIVLVFVQYILRVWSHFIRIIYFAHIIIFKTFVNANLLVPFSLHNQSRGKYFN